MTTPYPVPVERFAPPHVDPPDPDRRHLEVATHGTPAAPADYRAGRVDRLEPNPAQSIPRRLDLRFHRQDGGQDPINGGGHVVVVRAAADATGARTPVHLLVPEHANTPPVPANWTERL